MKIKEMFKKVNAYNEIAEITGAKKATIWLFYGSNEQESFTDYATMELFIKETFPSEIAVEMILSDKWFFGREWYFIGFDRFGMNYRDEYIINVGTR